MGVRGQVASALWLQDVSDRHFVLLMEICVFGLDVYVCSGGNGITVSDVG